MATKEKKPVFKTLFVRTRGNKVGESYIRYFKSNAEMEKSVNQMVAHLLIIAEVEANKG